MNTAYGDDGRGRRGAVIRLRPSPLGPALHALARCVVTTAGLLAHHRVRLPARHVDMRVCFGDGTNARVYRETVVDGPVPDEPCVLVVAFRLRGIRGWGHAAFRRESLLNTPMFVGFPGFVSKLWLAHDEHGTYRGLYEWDGPHRAEAYARALWWVLAPFSVQGSVRYRVLPGLRRDDLITDPAAAVPDQHDDGDWWRAVRVVEPWGRTAG